MAKWKWFNSSQVFFKDDEDRANRMEYLDKLLSLECAIMGVEPEINHSGHIYFDSDKMYKEIGWDKPREPLWDFEDVLEKAMKFNNTEPK